MLAALQQDQNRARHNLLATGMFERLLSSILTRILGEYVEDSTFSTESVQLGIWNGEIKLQAVTLRYGSTLLCVCVLAIKFLICYTQCMMIALFRLAVAAGFIIN